MERMTRLRARILLGLFAFIMVLYAMRLFNLQIIDTKGNTDNTTTYGTVTTVRAARGDILDRNGKVLVGNRASYDLVFNHFVIKSADNRNEYLYTLLKKCEELGVEHQDHLPNWHFGLHFRRVGCVGFNKGKPIHQATGACGHHR